ncbi:MAG: dephospho-CoA kinase [Clostridia bacterium]|nr:dephospho-CoA kinase [Clostridia bacterium]
MLIGLCGRSGSGKGYIAAMFAKRGVPSIDTDRVYRDMTGPALALSPCMQELKERFGENVVSEDGSLNRAVMRSLVFGPENKKSLDDLNRITHAHILKQTMTEAETLREAGADIILIDAPLLYESGFDRLCQAVICVNAPEEKRIERIMKRDIISREDAEKRLRTQTAAEDLLKKADYVIENDAEKDVLQERVDGIIADLRSGKYKDLQ